MDNKTVMDLEEFQIFLSKQLNSDSKVTSLEEAVAEFRRYKAQLRNLRDKLDASARESEANGSYVLTDAHREERYGQLEELLAKEGTAE